MKTPLLEKFKKSLEGRYIFHVHTNYTDGKASVEDYCLWAVKHGYETLFFTEHVRKKLDFNFSLFLFEVEQARKKWKSLNIWVGIEAKVLPGGDLDLDKNILPKVQLVCFAFHSFDGNEASFKQSFIKVLADKRWKKYVRVWFHPSTLAKDKLRKELLAVSLKEGIFIENNKNYDRRIQKTIQYLPQSNVIIGINAHKLEDLEL